MRGLIVALYLLVASTAAAQSEFWCWDADEIRAEVKGGSVRIQHVAALYNCCPEPITYEILVGAATILVEEHTLAPCDCDCCANLEVTLEDVPPGPWNILFRWFDLESLEWVEEILLIVVPDVGQALEPVVAGQSYSGCLEASHISDALSNPVGSWTIKALPNPARTGVTFSVTMTATAEATVHVFDVQGRLVDTVFDGMALAGVHEFTWSSRKVGVASGVYYVRLHALDRDVTRRFVLLR